MVAIQQITNASVDIFRNFYILCKGEGGGKKKKNTQVLDNQTEICLTEIISDII